MKKMNSTIARLTVAMAVIAASTGMAYSDTPGTGGTVGYQPIVIKLPPRNPKEMGQRPKAPSMQNVTCTYDGNSLTFEFALPEGQCQLVLSDPTTGETVAAGFDSAVTEPVYVGYHATASLTVTTANGNTYTGMW